MNRFTYWKALTIKWLVELDPVLVDKVAVVLSMPEAGITEKPHNIGLRVLGRLCRYGTKKDIVQDPVMVRTTETNSTMQPNWQGQKCSNQNMIKTSFQGESALLAQKLGSQRFKSPHMTFKTAGGVEGGS